MLIYLIVNHETGKYYVGQHGGNNLNKYLQTKFSDARHGRGGNSHLLRSMRKHPFPSSWSIHALRSDIQTRDELDETERDFIKFLRSQDPEYGYNICRGGEGFTGPHTKETCQKMSSFQKERWKCPEVREAASQRAKELWQRPSHREHISQTSTEMWKRPGHRENHIAKNIGKKRSAATIAVLTKFRRARLGKEISPETRKKMHNASIGRKRSEESRRKQSLSISGPLHCNYGKPLPEVTKVGLREFWLKRPKIFCSVEDCGRLQHAHTLCSAHYQCMRKHGSSLMEKPLKKLCPIEGCDKLVCVKGLCKTHDQWRRRHGGSLKKNEKE